MERDKLKPCPFCGETPIIESGLDCEGFAEFYIYHVCELEYMDIEINLSDNNYNALVKAWNTRI